MWYTKEREGDPAAVLPARGTGGELKSRLEVEDFFRLVGISDRELLPAPDGSHKPA
jgi:hypothetical protein